MAELFNFSQKINCIIKLPLRVPVVQWVMHPTRTRLVPGSKHDWCKNPLVFAMIATWTIGLAEQCLNWFPSSVQPNTLKGLAKFPYYEYVASGRASGVKHCQMFCADVWKYPLWRPLKKWSTERRRKRRRNTKICRWSLKISISFLKIWNIYKGSQELVF